MVRDGLTFRLAGLIGRRIAEARLKAEGLSQAALARRTGLSRGSIANIEAGRQRPPLETLWAIADALGIEPRQLLPSRADLAAYEQESLVGTNLLESEAAKPLEHLNLTGSKAHIWVAETLLALGGKIGGETETGGQDERKATGEESGTNSHRTRPRGPTRQAGGRRR